MRLAEREADAEAARLAAVTARVGPIVEGVDLPVGNLQIGLLDARTAVPPIPGWCSPVTRSSARLGAWIISAPPGPLNNMWRSYVKR